MASSSKRKHEIVEADAETDRAIKKAAFSNDVVPEKQLKEFLNWCEKNDFQLSAKVCVSRKGSCAQYGMIALEDIPEGYGLFQAPRVSLLQPSNSKIGSIIQKEQNELTESNQWVPLLITLLYEQNQPDSNWKPYTDLVPDFEELDLPLFWHEGELDRLLKGTGVDRAVKRDLKRIQEDFSSLVKPFFERHRDVIGNSCDNIDLLAFKKVVAFVMAYSFTEPVEKSDEDGEEDDDEDEETPRMLPPMMVPMADMLNHVTQNNAKLTFGANALKMVTTRPIKKGEEIYNTYGQVSNLHLMHMYGFSEAFPQNTNDVVEIPFDRLKDAAEQLNKEDLLKMDCLPERWEFLSVQDIIADDDETLVVGTDGIVNDEICTQALKVLSMEKSQFEEYVEKEGWSDAESQSSLDDGSALDFGKISRFDAKWKQLLKRMAQLHLQRYPSSLADDERQLENPSNLRPREKFSFITAHGQKQIITKLIDACS